MATTNIGFVNNGIMALFSSAQYIIGTTKIESIDNDFDVASTIIGLARYTDDVIRSDGSSMVLPRIQMIMPMMLRLKYKYQIKIQLTLRLMLNLLLWAVNLNIILLLQR